MDRQVKYVLQESEMPRQWYNIIADLPSPPPPPLHPGTRQPVGPDDLAPLFPAALIAQEVSPERHIAIPDEVLGVYRLWRPTPLFRARRLKRDLGTPARIYYKYEGGSPAGSHKPNTAVPQAYYNSAEGVTKLTTETGAGQWGSALAFASALFGLDLEVWMVRASYDQKPYRKLPDRGRGEAAVGVLRGGAALRQDRGDRPGAGARARGGRLHRGGAALQADRRGEGHPDRPVWARPA
jgi:tryptophan synthase beta chain